MKTQYYTASSLDGFIATSDHSLEWLFPLADLESSSYPAFIAQVGALAMGSSTYEWLLKHIVKPGTPGEAPWPYSQPAWVFTTRTLPRPHQGEVRFVQGDVRPVHAAMAEAAGGKNIWIVGGGDLAGQFYDRGLLDELIIQVAPVTLGRGMPLFPREVASPPLRLVSATTYGGILVELRYEVPR